MGYQEMIFNYLGSKKEYIDNMNRDSAGVIEISNPMSENYQFVRPSIISSLLGAEAGSGNAVYPHKIFEVGKTAFLTDTEVTGTKTIQSLGFLTAAGTANYNDAASEVATLLYFLGHEYAVRESSDTRFITGRQAELIIDGEPVGVFGEVHPRVLENWAITVPCIAGEINLEKLLSR
jgi:phenylalanyl-tRNA synthetase beta chain